jgi:hypothetical protein
MSAASEFRLALAAHEAPPATPPTTSIRLDAMAACLSGHRGEGCEEGGLHAKDRQFGARVKNPILEFSDRAALTSLIQFLPDVHEIVRQELELAGW